LPVLWTYPAAQAGLPAAAGTAVTAAALTAGTPVPPPICPPLAVPGMKLRLQAELEITSTSATPTVILGFYIGAVGGAIGSATVLAVTSAQAISASAASWPITMRWKGTFRSLGTAVTAHGTGELLYSTSLTAWTTAPYPVTLAARTTAATVNTEQSNQIDVGVTLSSVSGTPSVTVTELFAELIG